MKLRIILLLALVLSVMLLSSCSGEESGMADGYYTAEGASFDRYGWKEYVTIYVSDSKILTVEYDAYNASGFVRSWDINYMRVMARDSHTYPNEFTRNYSVALINWQELSGVDAIAGATDSYDSFHMLAEAAMAKAREGDKKVALVDLS